MTLQPEQTILNNKYKLVKRIGQGSYGEVWLALHELTQVQVAIKVGRTNSAEYQERALREMRISSNVEHPYLLAAKTAEQDNEHLYLILPYADGGSLIERLALKEDPLPVDEALEIATAIAQGLGYLHERDLVHRDVHPGNILFREGVAKLCDFGLIQSHAFSDDLFYGHRVGGRHPGNMHYLPPEAWATPNQPLKPLRFNADVYMLGAILWEMLTGRVYYNKRGKPPNELRPDVPAWLDELVMECLAEDPDSRPKDGNKLFQRLEAGARLAQQDRWRSLYQDATAVFEKNDWDTVVKRLSILLDEAPHYRDAKEMLAKAKNKREEQKRQEKIQSLTTKAESALEQSNWTELEQVVTELKSFDQSVAHPYQEALQKHQENERQLAGFYLQGKKAFEDGDWKTAIQYFEALLDKAPQGYENAEALLTQARQKEKRVEEARREQEEIQALVKKAQAVVDKGDYKTLRAVISELKPLSSEQAKPFEQALEAEAERQRQQQAHLDEQYKKAQVAFENGEWNTSITTLQALLSDNKNYPGAKQLLSRSQDKQQQEEEAKRKRKEIQDLVEQAQIAQSKSDWRTLRNLTSTLEARAPTKAKPFSQALQTRWTDLYRQGEKAFDKGNWDEAVKLLQPLVNENPTDRKAKGLLDRAKEAQHKAEEAQRLQQQIQSLKMEAQEAHRRRDWKALRTLVARLKPLSPIEVSPFERALAQEDQRRRRQVRKWGSVVGGSLFSLIIIGTIILFFSPGEPETTPAPTTSAIVTSIPVPSEVAGVVSSDDELGLRYGPGLQFGLLTTLPSNTRVTATARDETLDWLFVHLADDTAGWVSAAASSIKWNGDASVLPVSNTLISTPTSTPSRIPTPTQTSTLTPTGIPDEVVGVITTDSLNVRAGPGSAFDVLVNVTRGERVVAIARDRNNEWMLVRLPDDSEGWLASSLIEWEGDPVVLPVQEVAGPTPTPSNTATSIPLPRSVTSTPTSTTLAPTSTVPLSTATNTPIPVGSQLRETRFRDIDGMTQVYIPEGTFLLGSREDDPMAYSDEIPQKQAAVNGFWMDKFEVAFHQYQQCVEAGVCERSGEESDELYNRSGYPVVGVGWESARDYCAWVGGRLPTEAEWEYAARGPESRQYPWGNEFEGNHVNFCDTNCTYARVKNDGFNDGHMITAPVDSFLEGTSWSGILNMAGNVSEFVDDWYTENHESTVPSNSKKVVKGGSWASNARDVRSANRIPLPVNVGAIENGFRCVGSQ